MDETLKAALIDHIIVLAKSDNPHVHLGSKYGGTVFMTDPDVARSLVGGVFSYKDYVTVEFSDGATFDDPNGLLEGNGKLRRHVKLRGLAEVDKKNVAGFLAQAFAG